MVLYLDATNRNADWVKLGVWDIPATNAVELQAWLDTQGITSAQFKQLPVYRLNQHRFAWLAAFDQPTPETA